MKLKNQLSQSLTTTINLALLEHWDNEFTPRLAADLDDYLGGDAFISLLDELQERVGDYLDET